MTIDAAVLIGEGPDSLEGTKVTTPAGTDLFREGVVISDPEIPGARAEVRQMGTELTTADWGLVTHSVIQGFSTGQGGGYHDVKVTPSGALTVEASVTGVVSVEGTVQIAEPVTVDGTVALDAATLAALETINVGNFPATQVVSDGGGSLTVDGSVSVNNHPASQSVVGAGAAATAQRVQLADESLAALENISATVSGTVSVGNTVAVSATDLDIRNLSSAQDSVSVTGSVNVGNFPATQQVAGTVTVTATDLDTRNLTAAQDNIRAFDSTDSEYLRVATSVTTAGDTTLVTPAAGKRIRLQWVYAINDPTASVATKLTIKLGTAVQYVAWAISKRQQLTGAVDAPLVINLSAAGDVAVTVFYQEV